MRSPSIEQLELRRLFAVDLVFTNFELTGDPLFQPGGTTNVIVNIRSDALSSTGAGSVDFKFVDIGFRSDTTVSFDDPTAQELSTTAITGVPSGPVGKSFTFPLTFATDFHQGRYTLVGKVSSALSTADDNTRDFGTGRALPTNGNLEVTGSDAEDHISITAIAGGSGKSQYDVNVNGDTESFSSTKIKAFTVDTKGGSDVFVATGAVPKLKVNGGDGADKLVAGDGDDTLSGGAGKDSLYGGAGADRLGGDGGNDRLYGEEGVDRLYGGAGNDYLDAGAASDRLDGGSGIDTLYGQGGNDRFFTRDNEIDELFGGSGNDTAVKDANDIVASI